MENRNKRIWACFIVLFFTFWGGYAQEQNDIKLKQDADFKHFARTFLLTMAEQNHKEYEKAILYGSKGEILFEQAKTQVLNLQELVAESETMRFGLMYLSLLTLSDTIPVKTLNFDDPEAKTIFEKLPVSERSHFSECKLMKLSTFSFWAIRYKQKWYFLGLIPNEEE